MQNRNTIDTTVMKRIGILILFILIGAGLYANSLRNSFHYDDEHHIYKNPYIRTIKNIPIFFIEPQTFSIRSAFHPHYRPLVLTSYAVNYHFGGLSPRGYHLVNLGFHIGSAFLVFMILQAMLGRREDHLLFVPLAAGFIFLTTPFNSEVVNYISARSSVMCTFFYLITFYFWIKFTPPTPPPPQGGKVRKRVGFYIASLLTFSLAMLTKEIAVTLPVMLWLYGLYFVRNRQDKYPKSKGLLPYIPFLVIGSFIGIISRLIFFGQFGMEREFVVGTQILTAVKVLSAYFIKVLIPTGLSVWHQIDVTIGITFWISLIVVIGLAVTAYAGYRSLNLPWRVASFFILWFFLVPLPASVLPLSTPFQENRGYLACIGAVIIFSITLEGIGGLINPLRQAIGNSLTIHPKYISLGILLAIISLYSVGTLKRNQVWQNDLTLWSDVLTKYPDSKAAHLAIGTLYKELGRRDRAEKEYYAILAIDGEDKGAHLNLGIIYFEKGEYHRAEVHLMKALSKGPDEPITHTYLGRLYEARGDIDRAYVEYITAFKYAPDNMSIPEALVGISARKGTLDVTFKNFSLLKEKDPDNPAVRRALGLIYRHMGDIDLAAKEFEKVLSLVPGHIRTLMDLGKIYTETGRLLLAEETFKQVLEIRPSYHRARVNLASVYERQGRLNLAREEYRRVMEMTSPEGGGSSYYAEVQKILEGM